MCNCRKWPCPWNGTQAEGQEQQDEALPESPPETFTSLPPKPCPRGCASFPLGGILAEIKERNGCGPQSPLPQVTSPFPECWTHVNTAPPPPASGPCLGQNGGWTGVFLRPCRRGLRGSCGDGKGCSRSCTFSREKLALCLCPVTESTQENLYVPQKTCQGSWNHIFPLGMLVILNTFFVFLSS